MRDELKIDMNHLSAGEFSREALRATAELQTHPERVALAGVYHVLTLLLVIVAITATLTAPVLIYSVWTRG